MINRYVIALDSYCIYFLSALHKIMQHRKVENQEVEPIISYLLTESTNQALEIASADIQDFSINLLTAPNISILHGIEQFDSLDSRDLFIRCFREYAMALIVLLHTKVGIKPGLKYFLETINPEYMIVCESNK